MCGHQSIYVLGKEEKAETGIERSGNCRGSNTNTNTNTNTEGGNVQGLREVAIAGDYPALDTL